MGVLPIVLVILAMKVPILGLIWFVWWAGQSPEVEGSGGEPARERPPLRPHPWRPARPRRRGPHGGASTGQMPAHTRRQHGPLPAARARGAE